MVIIGEKINATIPATKEAILRQDANRLILLAEKQEEGGADLIDINVGTGEGNDEIRDMRWLVGLLKGRIKAKLCIDSADPEVIRAGLKEGEGKIGIINSVKGTEKSMAEVLPLVAPSDVPVIALAMDEGGIPQEVTHRLKVCEKIIKAAEDHGIPRGKIYFDPLLLPLSTDAGQGMVSLETLRRIREAFPETRTVLGLSNISFGLPKRSLINTAMLHMAVFLGIDAVILNPLDKNLMAAIKAAEVVLGKDKHCRRYIRAYRQGLLAL